MDKRPVIKQKPTLEQIQWVFACVVQNGNEEGSYRHLLEIMGVDQEPNAYQRLMCGLDVNNAMLACYRQHNPEDKA
jgi:hypothetical protein